MSITSAAELIEELTTEYACLCMKNKPFPDIIIVGVGLGNAIIDKAHVLCVDKVNRFLGMRLIVDYHSNPWGYTMTRTTKERN